MIDVVVINKSNAISDIENMLMCLEEDNVNKIFYIADRCSKNFNDYLLTVKKNNFKPIILDDNYIGRRTSTLRNIGYKESKKELNKSISGILFIDGDRFFTEGSTKDIDETKINNIPLDFIRHYSDEYLLRMKGQIINAFYSACVFLPLDICKKIEIDEKIWNENLEKIWGVEDLFMGNQFTILNIDYIYNRKIKLNNAKETGYRNDTSMIKNIFLLMQEIQKFKKIKKINYGQ